MSRALLALVLLVGCAKHEPPPWITSVRITGPDPEPGILGLSEDPDLPPVGPHLSDGFASRRTMWRLRAIVEHPWSRWWNFIPAATNLLGYTRVTVDQDLLADDADRIQQWYRDRGWRDAQVSVDLDPPSLWIPRLFGAHKRDLSLEAHFQVEAGVRHRLEGIDISGDPVDVRLPKLGSVWGLAAERAFVDALQHAAEIDGHGLAEVALSQRMEPDGSTLVRATVDRGPQVVFGDLTFSGNDHLDDGALNRAVGGAIAKGAPWDPVRVDRMERRLLRLPTIDAVEITRVTEGDPVPLHVHIIENDTDEFVPTAEVIGRPGTFTLIGGGTWIRRFVGRGMSEVRLHGSGGYRHIWRDVWGGDSGPAATAGAGLEVSLHPAATLTMHHWVYGELDQWHGYHYLRGDGEVGPRWARGATEAWIGYRASGWLGFPFPLQRDTFNQFFETGNQGNRPLERRYLLHQAVLSIRHDSRTHPVDPRGGALWTLDLVPFGYVEDARVFRVETDLDAFIPTPMELVTLRMRVGGGLLDVEGDDIGLLLGHRVYAGGPYHVRGWVDRGILPPGSEWRPGEPRVGGNVMAHATVEPRFHIHPHVILTPFLDAGSTWNNVDDVTFDTLRWSGGGGARFPLILGEGHLLFAWQLSDPLQDSQEPPMRIHLTLEGGL